MTQNIQDIQDAHKRHTLWPEGQELGKLIAVYYYKSWRHRDVGWRQEPELPRCMLEVKSKLLRTLWMGVRRPFQCLSRYKVRKSLAAEGGEKVCPALFLHAGINP